MKPHGIKIKTKKVTVSANVEEVAVKHLEMLGINVRALIVKTLEEAAGHYVCPVCDSLLKPKRKN